MVVSNGDDNFILPIVFFNKIICSNMELRITVTVWVPKCKAKHFYLSYIGKISSPPTNIDSNVFISIDNINLFSSISCVITF